MTARWCRVVQFPQHDGAPHLPEVPDPSEMRFSYVPELVGLPRSFAIAAPVSMAPQISTVYVNA
jgi:hypothetical protein